MAFTLTPLPFPPQALAPHMSLRTVTLHHDVHHAGYVAALNKLTEGAEFAGKTLEAIILSTAHDAGKAPVFNNAAQIWNHDFFWAAMKPGGGGKPSGELAGLIERSFGGYDAFHEAFSAAAVKQFGSGWVWLVFEAGKLGIVTTANAINPFASGGSALLGCDIWEHAYYLDFESRRADFVKSFLDHLVNWDFAARNLAKLRAASPE